MAFDLGSIIVTIAAKTDQLKSGLNDVQNFAGKSESAVGKFADGMKGALSTAMRLTAGVVAVGATAVGVISGIVLKGGFTRALDIEDANAKLKGLGYNLDQIKGITANTLDAVKGTAYSLNDAMTIATTAMAAGVKQGKDLTDYLKNVGDAATIANVPLGEMGYIFNKVKANGKLMTEELQMLQDRGLPVMQWLADSYGVSTAAMTKMVSSGQVDAARFEQVMHQHVGGAALTSADTVRGAWANMQAAMSRVGAAIVDKILPDLKGGIGTVTKFFDDNKDKIAEVADQIIDKMKKIGPAIKDGFQWLIDNQGAVIGAIIAIGVAYAWASAPMLATIAAVAAFVAVAAAIGTWVQSVIQQMGGWDAVWTRVKDTFGGFIDILSKQFGPILDIIKDLFVKHFLPALGRLWELIEKLKPVFVVLGVILGVALLAAISAVLVAVGLFIGLITFVINVVTILGSVVVAIVKGIADGWNWLNGVVSAIFQAIYKAGNDAWNGLKNAASNAWNWIKGVWGGAVGWFQGIWNSIAGAAGNLAQKISNAIGGAFSGLAGIVRGAVNWLIDKANGVIGAFNNASSKVGLPSVGQIPRLFQGVNGFLGGQMGGLALVGEQGPELLNLPNGSDVFTADRTRQMLNNGGSNSTQMIINVNNPIVTSSVEGERFAEVIGDNLIRRLAGQTRVAMR